VRTDTLFYRLFQDRPALVFGLAGLPLPPDAVYSLRAEEVKETAFRLDGLLVPSDLTAGHPLVFLEVQCQVDAEFYARWAAEIHLHIYRGQVTGAWHAVVIYPDRATEATVPLALAPFLGHPWVHRVYLDEALPEGAALSPGLALVRLIVAPPETAPAQAKALIQIAGPDRGWVLDWIETIFVNKFPKLSRAEILMILDLTDTDLRNTRYFQDVFAEGQLEGQLEGRKEGREEGREEGQKAGREEGRRGEAIGFVLRLLRRRLGPPAEDTQQRIAALTVPQLEALGEALLDFTQPTDLTDWLKQHG